MEYKRIIQLLLIILSILMLFWIKTTDSSADVKLTSDNIMPQKEESVVIDKPEYISLGTFKITYYCGEKYPHICNDGSYKTATGTIPEPGRTIAVDPDIIPYGTEVKINDHIYIAEDCGGAIQEKRIDIFCNTHQEALDNGIDYYEVYVKTAE